MLRLTTSLLLISAIIFTGACDNSTGSETVMRNQNGILVWGYPPEVDGVGMIFELNDSTVYALPGVKKDYDHLFNSDTNRVAINADFILTGEKAVRGWGATFDLIKFTRAERR